MDAKSEKIALFRFGVIASLVLEPLPRGELTRRAEEIAARHFDIPASKRTSVSVDTLLDWAFRYRNGGFEALAPQPRQDRGQSRTITPQLADLVERLKRENPHRTGTTLLRELALSAGQDTAGISASTLYRFLKQRGLSERQLLAPQAHKKFEAEHSNQIWQSDMLYGPYVQRPGGGKMQALLHAILDDASRLIPHAQFYASQGLDACLDCLRQAVAARGAAIRLYMDNAKIYRSPQLARIAASIGMLIVHTPPYQPEGRGKIERFFRSCREQFLNNLDRKQTLSLEELNDRLWPGSTFITAPSTARWEPRHCCVGSAISSTSANCLPPPTSAASSFIAWIALCAATAPSCYRIAFTKRRPIWPAKPSKRAPIRSIPPLWRSISRANPKVPHDSSIPSSTVSCPQPSRPKRRNPNPPASTSSICS